MHLVEGVAHVESVEAFVEELERVATTHDTTVQAFDARYVVDREHLERAVELATRERERGEAIVRDEGVEVLLYAAGRRQIHRALEMGISEGACPVVVVVVGGDERAAVAAVENLLDQKETLGECDSERVRSFFEVSDRELEATAGTLADVVHERVAMLVVER